MLHIIRILILTLAVTLFAGCSRHSTDGDKLNLAESIIWINPDSALTVIESIAPDSLSGGDDRARYALLRTMAMDKAHLAPTEDSAIAAAVDYFESSGDMGRRIVAGYYHGRVLRHKQQYQQALLSYYRTKELAEKADSSFWAGMACWGVSGIYLETYNRAEELTYAQKEYEYIKRSGRQPYLNYALLDLGRAYANNGHNRKAIAISEEVADSAKVAIDDCLYYCALHLKSNALLNERNYLDAYPVLGEIFESGFAECIDSVNMCRVLAQKGMYREAMTLLNKVSDAEAEMKGLVRHVVYRATGQLDKAISEGDYLDSITGGIFKTSMTGNLAGTLSDYYELEKRTSDAELTAARMRMWLLIVIALVTILAIALIAMWIYRRQRQAIDRKMVFAERLEEELVRSAERFARTEESLNEANHTLAVTRDNLDMTKRELSVAKEALDRTKVSLASTEVELGNALENLERRQTENEHAFNMVHFLQSTKYELLEELADIVRCSKDTLVARRKIADAVTKLIADLSHQSTRIEELEKAVDTLHGNLYSDFRRDMPKLKDVDYRLFLFSVLQISSDTIALFLKADSVTAVYNRKRRIKNKIKTLAPGKAERYQQFL